VSRRRSFAVDREPIELEFDDDVCTAPSTIPSVVLAELLDAGERVAAIQTDKSLTQKEMITQVLKVLDEVFGLVLVPDSAKVFHERLYSRDKPLDLSRQVMPAMEYLLEEYTDRPLVASPPSTTGPRSGGTSSTPGALVGVSTPSPSPLDGSATPSTPPSST
jgi:hypothetical protein